MSDLTAAVAKCFSEAPHQHARSEGELAKAAEKKRAEKKK